jgi:hypothetical protein
VASSSTADTALWSNCYDRCSRGCELLRISLPRNRVKKARTPKAVLYASYLLTPRSSPLMVFRVHETIDVVRTLPQTGQVALVRVSLDVMANPEAGQKVARAFLLGERKARPPRYFIGQLRMRRAHEVDLGSHLWEAEVLIVETDAYLAAFRTRPQEHV